MLEVMSKQKENRIIRNLGIACTQNIEKLNKYGYNWLMCKSGFIAHYNCGRFIEHYCNALQLAQAVLENQGNNQYSNFYEGETNYAYYMQSKDMYNCLCDIINGKKKIPSDKKGYKPLSIMEDLKRYPFNQKCIDTFHSSYMHVFNCGTFFCGDYSNRSKDLAVITELYCQKVANDIDFNERKFYDTEYKYPSGNQGTFHELMRNYGDHLWDTFAELTGQLEEAY